jgi:hypothetical protein
MSNFYSLKLIVSEAMISVYSDVEKAPDRCRGVGPPVMKDDKFVVGSVRLVIIILIEGSTLDSCYDIHMLHH